MVLKAKHIVGVVSFFAAIFICLVWSYEQKIKYQGINLVSNSHGQLMLSMYNDLILIAPNGQLTEIDLADFNVYKRIGAISRFSNGDLLLRSQNQPTAISDRVLAQFDNTFQSGDYLANTLVRCRVAEKQCSPALGGQEYPQAFDSFISLNDQIIITDPHRHQLSYFSENGTLIDTIDEGLSYPSQANIQHNSLLIANSDMRKISIHPWPSEQFTEPDNWQYVSLDIAEAIKRKQQYPTQVLLLNEQYWVLAHDASFTTSSIFVLGLDGILVKVIETPIDVTLDSMALFMDSLVATSRQHNQVFQFSLQGDYLGPFQPLALSELLKVRQQQYQQLQFYFNSAVALGACVFIALAWLGIKQEQERVKLENAEEGFQASIPKPDLTKPTLHDPEVQWLEKSTYYLKLSQVMPWLIGVMATGMVYMLYRIFAQFDELSVRFTALGLMVLFSTVLYLAHYCMARALKTRLGHKGHWLIVENHEGIVTVRAAHQCYFTSNMLMVDDLLVPLGSRAHSVFCKKDLKTHIQPILHQANRISEFEYYRRRWHAGDPLVVFGVPLAVALMALAWYLDYLG